MTLVSNVDTAPFADLFSPALRRERVVDWQAPVPAAKAASVLSGLEAMRAIRDGILPPPPMARLIGFSMRVAEPGLIVMELEPHEGLENTVACCMAAPPPHCSTPPSAARSRPGCRPTGRAHARSQVGLPAGRSRCNPAPSAPKGKSSSSVVKPATPRVLFATAPATWRCTQPRRFPWSARAAERALRPGQ